jgi:hypothetical protein
MEVLLMRRFSIALFLISVCLTLAACSPQGVPQSEYDDLIKKNNELNTEIILLQNEIRMLMEERNTQDDSISNNEGLTDDSTDDNNNNEIVDNTDVPPPAVNPGKFSAEDVESKITVTEHVWSVSRWHYVAYVLENNSDFLIQLDLQVVFKDSDGNTIGAKNDSLNAFEPGTQSALVFSNDEEFSSTDFRISTSEESWYTGVISAIDIDVSTTSDKAIVAATNNGEIPASFVQYIVLFFNGDNVVDYDWGYLSDSDFEIKPGRTEIGEQRTRTRFDSVEVYLTGRGG